MRLIYYVLFLFCSLGANLVKAAPTLDLDTYDPEEFNLVLHRRPDYTIENFTPKANDQITRVTASGQELFGSDGSETVSFVKVYSVRSVPQLVEILPTNSFTSKRFQNTGSGFQQIDVSQFINLHGQLDGGSFTPNLGFTLNLQSRVTPRNLFVVKEHLVDGVTTFVFTPTSEPKIMLVKEGDLTVATATPGEHFTKVTVSMNGNTMSLALVESSKDGTPHAYYFHKTSTWKTVLRNDYERLLAGLHPVDVYETVTLDINEPNDKHFQLEKDFDAGLTETVFNPLRGFEVTKVTLGNTELWSSNVNRSSKVVVYSDKNGVKLVKVEVKNADGQATDVLLYEDQGTFRTANAIEFSDRVQGLKRPRSGHALQAHGSAATLDVVNPNLSEFQVLHRSFKGVQYKEFSRIDGESIHKVVSSGTVVFEPVSNVAVTHVNAYLKDGVPTVYQVSGVVGGNEPFNSLLKLDQGLAVAVDSLEFQDFLKNATKAPTLKTKLKVDLENPVQENVAVYTSKVYGLDNTVAQAHDGFFFGEVNFGDAFVWSANDHPGVSVTQVVAFRNITVTPDFKLLELDGFKGGDYLPFYYEKLMGHWKLIDQATFQSKFRLLKFPDLGQPRSRSGSQSSPEFSLPAGVPEEGAPAGAEAQEEQPEPTVAEEPGWHTAPPAPEEPEWHAPEAVPEEAAAPTVQEEQTVPEQPAGPESVEELPEGPTVPQPESNEPEVVVLDTENLDETKVSMIAGSEEGYYFKSYAPRSHVHIGSVHGPNGFKFDGRGARHVTLVKFFWVHSKLVGANLFTTSVSGRVQFVYYYTYQNGKWDYTFSMSRLTELIANESAYTDDQKADLQRMRQHTENINKSLEKIREQDLKEIEERRKQEEKENKVVMPKKLSHKTRLYDEMADLDQHPPPKAPEAVEETEEQLEKRRHSYAGGDKILVESELLYFELSTPKTNNFVHTKDYICMGLRSIDVTPFSGRFLHVVSLHGTRVWVSSNNRRATNMQVFYADDQIVGALLKVTSVVRGTTITGEEFDYLFVKDGQLQKVNVADFMNLANIRFQSAALVNLSTAPKTQ